MNVSIIKKIDSWADFLLKIKVLALCLDDRIPCRAAQTVYGAVDRIHWYS
jgi:hypothetical protein